MPGKKRQQPAQAAAVEEEEAFPRGGAGADDLTPLERRKLALQAEADFRHEQDAAAAGGEAPSKKKQKRGNDQDEEGAFFSKQSAGGKSVPQVQQLKHKSLHVGMKLLGCVLEVSGEQLSLALPFGLRATVPAAETSDLMHAALDPGSKRGAKIRAKLPGGVPPPLTQLFSVGQYVRCVIKDLGSSSSSGSDAAAAANGSSGSSGSSSKKRVTATLRLKAVLAGVSAAAAAAGDAGGGYFEAGQVVPAVVRSIEDRGYALDLGVKGVSGFLPSKDYASYYGPASPPLLPGTLLDVAVSKAPAAAAAAAGPEGAIVQVSVAHDAVSGGVLRPWEGLNMGSLLPGNLVSVRVRQVARDGLHVSFCGYFSGTIEASHLGAPLSDTPWNKRYQVGQKVLARLLYVDTAAKTTGLSCLTHLINMRLPTAVPRMGQVFPAATVCQVDPGLGLLLRLPMEPEPAAAFVHVSNLSDTQLSSAEVAKRFKVGSEVACRVIGFRLVDGLVAASCKQSVIEQQVYSVKDLYPGQPLEVTVLDTTPAGLVVALTPNLKGLVPRLHMSDSGGTEPKASKFKPGKKLAARVLSVDASRKQVTLTLKKGLLGSKLPVLADLRTAEPGLKLHGVVTGIAAYGVFVGFYGGVSGLIPNKDLDLLPGQQAGDVYSPGQLLRVQVVSTDMRKHKLFLRPASKKADDNTPAAAAAAAAAAPGSASEAGFGGHAVGSVLSGGGVVQQLLQRPIQEGGGLVELMVEGDDGSPVLAHLPAAHLSDHPGGVEALMSVLRVGATLPGPLLVLQHTRIAPDQHAATSRWQGGEGEGNGLANGGGAGDGSSDSSSDEGGSDSEDEQQAQQQQQKRKAKQQQGGDAMEVDGEHQQQQQEKVPVLLVSRKQSLLAAAVEGKLPGSAGEVSAGAVLPGYVASVTRDGVFVRFLGRCTGRAGLPQMADTFVTDPTTHFNTGQSVMAAVLTVDEGAGRFSLSLKPSVAGHHAGDYIRAYASDVELAYKLHLESEAAAAAEAAAGGSPGEEVEQSLSPVDFSALTPGALAPVRLDQMAEYGAIMDVVGQEDLVGLVHPHQGTNDKDLLGAPGQLLQACVLDVDKVKGVVDLSLKPDLTHMAAAAAAAAGSSSKKSSKKQQQQLPEVGSQARAVVLEIKEHYVVVALQQQQQQTPDTAAGSKKPSKKASAAAADAADQQQQQYVALGFVARGDFNSQGSTAKDARRFKHDQSLRVAVVAHPSPANGMRLLLEPTQTRSGGDASSKQGRGKQPSGPKSALVPARVAAVHDWNLEVTFGYKGKTARIHVAELQERLSRPPVPNPLAAFKVDQEVEAAYLGHPRTLSKRTKDLQLSLRPSALNAAKEAPPDYDGKVPFISPVLTPSHLHPHLLVVGWVTAIEANGLWLTLAPGIQGKLHVFETSDNPQQLAVPLEERFSVGQALQVVIKSVDLKRKQLSLSMRPDRISQGVTDPAAAAAKAAAAPTDAGGAGGAADEAAAADGGSSKRRLPPAGQLVTGKVSKVLGAGVVIELTKTLKGIVALTDLHDSWVPQALAGLNPGQFVRARVLGAEAAGAAAGAGDGEQQQQQQPLVDKHGHLLLSLRPSQGGAVAGVEGWGEGEAEQQQQQQKGKKKSKQQQQQQAAGDGLLDLSSLKHGDKVQGYVRGVSDKGLFLALDRLHHGRVKKNQLSDGFIEDPAAAFPIGSLLTARVLSVQTPGADAAAAAGAKSAAAAAGAGAGGGGRWSGRVLGDDGVRVELSLLSGELSGLRQIGDVQEGELTQGKVCRVEPYGVFVQLHRSQVRGLVHVSQVERAYSKELAKHYTPGQVVAVRVLSVDPEARKVSLSMKADLLVGSEEEEEEGEGQPAAKGAKGSKKAAAAAPDFDEEMVDALDTQQQQDDSDSDSGSDSELEGSDSGSGSEEGSEDEEGVDLDDMDVDDEGEAGSSSEEGSESGSDEDADSNGDAAAESSGSEEEEEEGSSSDEEGEGGSDGMPPRGLHNLLQPELLGPSGADWGELQLADDDAAAAAGGKSAKAGLTKADKKRLKAQKEAEIAAAERARLAGGSGGAGAPESAAGYEQQLLASPNDSYLWIKYMAFQLKLGEVEAARRIAERALSGIAMTAERDKFNVWVALMNLEDAYGGDGAEEALMAVFNRALRVVEQKPLYLALLGILERSGRRQLAGEVWRTATKKFNTSCKVWLGAFEAALQAAQRQADAAAAAGDDAAAAAAGGGAGGPNAPRQLLERALKSLPKRKHVKALTRAALAEFRLGCPERGRSVFEGVLVNCPKRTDLWNVYLDQEVKAGDAARVRSLLARVTSLALPPKKMKGFFRRWLEYEEAHGTAADVEGVKQRAMDYMRAQEAA